MRTHYCSHCSRSTTTKGLCPICVDYFAAQRKAVTTPSPPAKPLTFPTCPSCSTVLFICPHCSAIQSHKRGIFIAQDGHLLVTCQTCGEFILTAKLVPTTDE